MARSKATKDFLKSWEEYDNSMDLDFDVICSKLANGDRSPQNDEEKKILAEINSLKAAGKGIEFPFD